MRKTSVRSRATLPKVRKMIKKQILFLSLGLLSGLLWTASATAQTAVDDATARQMMEQVNDAARKMKTLQCSFVQTKTLKMMKSKLVSNGRMSYSQPALLRWEYTSPYAYTFIVNGAKVLMKSRQRRDVVNAAQNKVFREITNIMLNSVTGKCLTDKQNFTTRMLVNGDKWIARLTPMKKEMKQLFSTLVITFDKRQMVAVSVEMIEKSGDNTLILLRDVKKNAPVDADEFKVD